MESAPDKHEIQKIDVEKILYSKNPALRKVIPAFYYKLSEKDCTSG